MNKERYWTFVLYPESAPSDWKEQLQQLGLQCAISPLHNKDINSNGEIKKEHYHILLCFNGPTTYNKVNSICQSLNATIPQRVLSCKGMIRYFTHKDNPEKAQYNDFDITTINGLDLKQFNDLTLSQTITIKKEIICYINDNNIRSYNKLVNIYAYDSSMRDYFQVVSSSPSFFRYYIQSGKEDIIEDRQKINN